MIHESSYVAADKPRLHRPLVSFFEVDERIWEESARVYRGEAYDRAPSRDWLHASLQISTDAAAITLGIAVVWLIMDAWAVDSSPRTWAPLFGMAWLGALGLGRSYPGWGIGPVDRLRTNARAVGAAIMAGMLAAALAESSSLWLHGTMVASAAAGGLFLIGFRWGLRRVLSRYGLWGVPTVFYGTTDSARRIVQVVQAQSSTGFRPVGIFEDDPRMWGRELCGVPVLGDTGLVHPDASVAVVASIVGPKSHAKLDALLRYYRRVVVIPDLVDQSTTIMQPVDFGGLLGLQLRVNLSSPLARGVKQAVEFLATSISSPLWGAAVGIAAGLIWLEDRRSPFYSQVRIGRGGHEIRVLKLRTMVPDAEAVLEEALTADPTLRIEWEATSKLQNDPRITRVGALLRRLSIDELPQLINVLAGQMSLIGPRPLPEYHESKLAADARHLRRRVRPGVTGLWQVSGRSDTGDEGIEWLDSYYVRNWSIWLDLAILLRTVSAALEGDGAY